ncbi:MAG TPA: sigma-70 family RNA polymerase sigma factor [Candidatus Dormibacteraeota bacterium]
MDDEARLRAADAAAFEHLLRDHARAMLQFADFVLHDRSAAEDAAQEAFVIAWKRRNTLNDVSAFVPWLRKIVLRECLRWRRHRLFLSIGLSDRVVARSEPDATLHLDMATAIQRLSPKLRAVVFLHFYEDLTLARIATELGIPESTAKTRLYEALRRLQRFLPAYTGSKSGERT